MKTLLFFFALTTIQPVFCMAQQDSSSIAGQIRDYELSKYDMISKGRRMLLDKFEEGNIEEVRDIIRYFDREINDKNHIALWPAERILLYYWTEDYDKIIDFSAYIHSEDQSRERAAVYPPKDMLYTSLQSASHESFDQLVGGAEKYHFSDDANDYLHLLLESLLYDSSERYVSMNKINEDADRFIENYPDSPLLEIVKEHISYKLTRSDFMFGMYLGGGYSLCSGAYTHTFRPRGALAFSVDLYWRRYALFLSGDVGFGKLRQDVLVGGGDRWEKGSSGEFSVLGLSLGYSVLETKNFRLTPFSGAAFSSINPTQKEDMPSYLEDFDIGTSCSGMVGFNVRYLFFNTLWNRRHRNTFGMSEGAMGVNARVAYVPSALRSEGHTYGGNIVFLTIGISIDWFGLKRTY